MDGSPIALWQPTETARRRIEQRLPGAFTLSPRCAGWIPQRLKQTE